jgi:hypothetical protein
MALLYPQSSHVHLVCMPMHQWKALYMGLIMRQETMLLANGDPDRAGRGPEQQGRYGN